MISYIHARRTTIALEEFYLAFSNTTYRPFKTHLNDKSNMTLEQVIKQRFNNIHNASKELGMGYIHLWRLTKKKQNIKISTVKEIAKKGLCVTVKNGNVEWYLDETL